MTKEQRSAYRKQLRFDKLVASNALNANHNLMESVKETNRVLWQILKWECDRIIKRYPSLA